MKRTKALLAVILAVIMLVTVMPLTGLSAQTSSSSIGQSNPDELPAGYVDNSNEGMLRLQEEYENKQNVQQNQVSPFSAAISSTSDITGKKVEIAFLIDASGSMAPYIAKVKENITAFAQYLESAGVVLRMAVIRFGNTADGERATVLKINGSSWHTSTAQLVQTLTGISSDGGTEALSDAIGHMLHNDPVTNLPNIYWSSDSYKFAFVLTNDFDTGVEGLRYNRYGYPTLNSTIPDLQDARIHVSVVTERLYAPLYNNLATQTDGKLFDITTPDYWELLRDYANGILGIALKHNKAIYVLPGYLGSKLYVNSGVGNPTIADGEEYWTNGAVVALGKKITPSINPGDDEKDGVWLMRSDANGGNSRVHADMEKDLYGTRDTYKNLIDGNDVNGDGDKDDPEDIKGLKDYFGNEYDVVFFPYDWSGDLNDSVTKLEANIKRNGYDSIVFVTHSTGGLLASAYIAKSRANKLKVEKAVLIAPPLFGTYSSLVGLETGQDDELDRQVKQTMQDMHLGWFTGYGQGVAHGWVRDSLHNSPTTYQLLPSLEYLKLMPQIYTDEFDKGTAVTNMTEYYRVLNGSSNINPVLTNGGPRSHETFRSNLGDVAGLWDGNVVPSLQEVDTIIVGASLGKVIDEARNLRKLTPAVAKYQSKLLGGTKLTDIVKKDNGDTTVLDVSAFALSPGKTHVLKYKDFADSYDHGGLATEKEPIQFVCDCISNTATVSPSAAAPFSAMSSEIAGMSNYIKINYSSNAFVSINIFDDAGANVAQMSESEFFGFDGGMFDFTPLVFTENENSGIIYMPSQGYKIVFSHGDEAGTPIEFSIEVSTLDENGWKDASASKDVNLSIEDGVLAVVDGTTQAITSDNIGDIFGGDVTEHFTDWELPATLKVNFGDSPVINLLGSQASQVAPLLNWSSSDDSIIEVDNSGKLTIMGYGKVTIAATDGNKVSACEVTVKQTASSVELSDIEMVIGERTLIRPQFTPPTATEIDMTYTLSQNGIIEINEYGVILALAAGTVEVTGTATGGASSTFIVTVIGGNIAVKSVSLTPDTITIAVNEQGSFTAEINPVDATNTKVTWYIDNASIASIISSTDSTCTVKGVSSGTTTIYAITNDGGYTGNATIIVSGNIASTKYALTIKAGIGGSVTNVSGEYEQGTVINISATPNAYYSFSNWSTSNGGVFGNATSATTTFTMPANATTVTANFKYIGGGSGGGGGGTYIPTYPSTTVKPSPVDLQQLAANELYKLNLFVGTDPAKPVFELDRSLTRLESIAIVLRLMGLEDTAQAYKGINPFTDVPTWGDRYAAYAYSIGLTVGINDEHTLFAPNRPVTQQEFCAFLLRILGYFEKNGDFDYANAVQKASNIGLFSAFGNTYKTGATFLRGDAVVYMVDALLTKSNGADTRLLDQLVKQGVITADAAAKFEANVLQK